MELQRLLSLTRKCIDTYRLIDDGDRIALGISGGKDSLSLLVALKQLQRFYPKKFDLVGITVDLNMGNLDLVPVRAMCEELGVEYHVIDTNIGEVLYDVRQETNPCGLCAKMRKGALNDLAKELGCNKIAYAHNKDDFIETAMMSLIYEGRYYTFQPNTYLDRMDLYVIRPMIYIDEADVKGFAKRYELPVAKNPCPVDGNTKREYVKNLIKQLEMENPGCRTRMFNAAKEFVATYPLCVPQDSRRQGKSKQ